MRLHRGTLIGAALFVVGYISWTLVDETYIKGKPLTGELIGQMLTFAGGAAAIVVIWYFIQKSMDAR